MRVGDFLLNEKTGNTENIHKHCFDYRWIIKIRPYYIELLKIIL